MYHDSGHQSLSSKTPVVILAVLLIICLAILGVLSYLFLTSHSSSGTASSAGAQRPAAASTATQAHAQPQADNDAASQDRLKKALEEEANATADVPPVPDHCDPPSDPMSLLVIVNKKYCFDPLQWAPSNMTTTSDGYPLRAEAAPHYEAMKQAAAAEGIDFSPSSTYRSYQVQVDTYNYWVQVEGSKEEADKSSARPGHSEHQSGLAADLEQGEDCSLDCFTTTNAYPWLQQHAADYGFIQRYPEGNLASITGYIPEPWHWRYVGQDVAHEMKKLGIKTLEVYEEYKGIKN